MVEAQGGRAQVKADLLQMADELWAGWDSYETIIEDTEKNYFAKRVTGEDNIPTTLIKYKAVGITEEQWNVWKQDPTVVAATLNQKLTRIELPDDEGHRVRLLKMKMPMLISNRSTLTTFYDHTKEDGTQIILHSSKGNEALNAANEAQIDGDVITNNELTYMSWKPFEGGIYIEHIVKMDPNGSIPTFIKNKGAERMASNAMILVEYLVNGTIPEPLF